MYESIKNFNKQFEYEPEISGKINLKKFKQFIVCGMGGSHLAVDILMSYDPALDLVIHNDYGLPFIAKEDIKKTLMIFSSYSGNTEEVVDSFQAAIKKKLPATAISIGGKLLELAKKHRVPYIQMPDTKIQPRMALGFSLRALLKIIGQIKALKESAILVHSLNPAIYEDAGKNLAEKFKGKNPVIYASRRNFSIAYNWKIKFNETGKIPAFCNVFPELNHNEMTGFDVKEGTRGLSDKFYFIIIKDGDDHPKIVKRMKVLSELYRKRGLPVEIISLSEDKPRFFKIFSALVLADWITYYTAKQYGVEPEQVPMVEEFKKSILEPII
ncbi:MAG: hypothetical protein US76_01900 [Parcubacteria group bacterium GW2011_GWA2_38_13b]|nr:MAG: hypothetical protein US76_01900 [Parcubacteria group bacterium GW2011_GWA2_38_13b]